MSPFISYQKQFAGLVLALLLATTSALAQGAGGLRGQVTDEFGGAVVGATVTLVGSSGGEKVATTNADGA